MNRPALIAVLCLSSAALADGLSGYVEEEYTHVRSTNVDGVGNTSRFNADQLTERYRLTLDRLLFPDLRFTAGGSFEELLGPVSQDGAPIETTTRTTSLFSMLALTGPILTATGGYRLLEQWSDTLAASPTRLVTEDPNLSLTLRPDGMPSFTLRLDRQRSYDTARELQDLTTAQALFSANWAPVRPLQLQYTFVYTNPIDGLHDTNTTTLGQTARALYSRSFWGDTALINSSLDYQNNRTEISSSGAGGTIATQQVPIAGFSLVEAFPQLPTLDTLQLNPGLIDGSTAASVGVDLGFGPTVAGDVNERDLGVQFTDLQSKVNTFYLWLDRPLPPAISSQFTFTAYQSDDNVHWTQVPVTATIFSPFQNRFEITCTQTAARYLKVVTKPLSSSVTVDHTYADIFVTELQTLLVVPVQGQQPQRVSSRANWSASLRTQLFHPSLSYDFTINLARTSESGGTPLLSYFLTNGLNFSRKLGELLVLNARLARQDQDQSGFGHQATYFYSASLAVNELPGLSHSLVYSGQASSGVGSIGTQNSISLYNRATPVRGIGLLLGLGYTLLRGPTGQLNKTDLLTFTATIQPHPAFTFAGTLGQTATNLSGGGMPSTSTHSDRLDGTVTFNPLPVLYLSAGASRTITESRGVTLANSAVNFSPFPGGNLQLGVTYTETYDPTEGISRMFSPTLRWNVRPGVLFTVTESLLVSGASGASTHTQTFDADLKITM